MASPQAPWGNYDPRLYRRYRRRSLTGPILLIAIGMAFLLANLHVISGARLAYLFATWWPLLLILIGVLRFVEFGIARAQGQPTPRSSGVGLIVLLVALGLGASSARRFNWQAMSDDIDVNPGFDTMWGEKYDFNQELSQPLPSEGRIQIDSDHGTVTVHVAENGDSPVKLVVHRHIAADSQNAANRLNEQQKPTMTAEGNVLRINSGEHQAQVHVGFSMGPRISSDLEIWAPRKAPVQVTSAHGDVIVTQRDADVNVSTTHGDTQISQINGNVESTSHHGNVHISQVKGDVHLDGKADDVDLSDITGQATLDGEFFGDTRFAKITKAVKFHSTRTDLELAGLTGDLQMDSGDLRVTSVTGPFEVHTKAKDIRLEEVSGPVTIEDNHGDVELHPQSPFGNISVSNHQGTIHVVVPESAGYTVDARSDRGELESDFSLNITQNGSDRVAQGSIGKGGNNKLQLTTDHGSIEIRKG